MRARLSCPLRELYIIYILPLRTKLSLAAVVCRASTPSNGWRANNESHCHQSMSMMMQCLCLRKTSSVKTENTWLAGTLVFYRCFSIEDCGRFASVCVCILLVLTLSGCISLFYIRDPYSHTGERDLYV